MLALPPPTLPGNVGLDMIGRRQFLTGPEVPLHRGCFLALTGVVATPLAILRRGGGVLIFLFC